MPLSPQTKFQLVQRFLMDPVFYNNYLSNKDAFIKQLGVTSEAEVNEIIPVLDQLYMGKLYADSQTEEYKRLKKIMDDSMEDTMETADSFKKSIRQSLKQINSGYMAVMIMYALAFLTGIGLIVAAIIMALNKQQNLLSIIFGSLGTMEILVFFFTKPAMHLQSSRIRHAQLEMGFYSWFVDVYNINTYMSSLGGKTDDPVMYARFLEVVDKQLVHTKETLQALKEFTISTDMDK